MEERERQQRKAYARRGQREQKMISFRADAETAAALEEASNKGRLINELVQDWFRSKNRPEHDDAPEERYPEDWEP